MNQSKLFDKDPNFERDLVGLVNKQARVREHRTDTERQMLRTEREKLLDELSIGTEALRHNVKEADRELEDAKELVRRASKKKSAAARELASYEHALLLRINRIETEIQKRPIGGIDQLWRKFQKIDKELGPAPYPSGPKALDFTHERRCECLLQIKSEIERLEQKESGTVALVAPSLQKRLERILQ